MPPANRPHDPDQKLSEREKGGYEASIEASEKRIDEAVLALYGVDGLPG